MRTKNSIRNSSVGLIVHISIMILNFVSRGYFIRLLGTEYLGINGLFTNILSMLNLAELGIGSAITYSLYKPLAVGDKQKVAAIMKVYKKAYYVIGIIVFSIGLVMLNFINLFIKGHIYNENLKIIFLLFLVETTLSYLLGYKRTLLEADQKIYILRVVNLIHQVISNILTIGVLMITNSYILYLIMRVIVHISENVFIIKYVNDKYSYINDVNMYCELNIEDKNKLKNNVKALFLHRVGGYFIFSTDNLIISKFIGITAVGIFSNYTIIIEAVNGVIKQIINSITASYGNLIVKGSSNKNYEIYEKVMFLNFWISGFCAVSLLCLLNPFIQIWAGSEYIVDIYIVIVMVINFYILSMRMSINIPRTTGGLFIKDRYACIIEAVINIVLSIILAEKIGVIGVLLGTTITSISVQFITVPYLCYKYIFNKPVIRYYIDYFKYLMVTLITSIITYLLCNINLSYNSYIIFLYDIAVCTIVPNLIFLIIYSRSDKLMYYLKIINRFRLKGINFNNVN